MPIIKQKHGGAIFQAEKGFTYNPNGRPRKLVGDVVHEMKKEGVKPATKTEIQECYLMLINLEMTEVEAKSKDQKQPILIRIVGKSILSGKGFEIIEKMLDRAIGKAEQKNDGTTGEEKINKAEIIVSKPENLDTLKKFFDKE
jgi:hypothetical protein